MTKEQALEVLTASGYEYQEELEEKYCKEWEELIHLALEAIDPYIEDTWVDDGEPCASGVVVDGIYYQDSYSGVAGDWWRENAGPYWY